MRTVYLLERCKPMGTVENWTVSLVCGGDSVAQDEKDRHEKRYPDSTWRVRPMEATLVATHFWKARDTFDVVHIVEQHSRTESLADCTFYCEMYVDKPLFYEDTFPPLPRSTEVTCMQCLADVEPALLRILG